MKKSAGYLNLLVWFIFFSIKAYDYDLVIIGAGASGITAVNAVARKDLRIAVIQEFEEQTYMSSSAIATKALIHAGQLACTARKAKEFGLSFEAKGSCAIFDYIRQTTGIISKEFNIKNLVHNRIDIWTGCARFITDHMIEVGNQKITGATFIIATGGTPHTPDIQGINDTPYFTEHSFFSLNELPESIIIAGEGPTGVEFATALHNLGVKVTLLTEHGLILPKCDYEFVGILQQYMSSEGISVVYHAKVTGISSESDGTIVVSYKNSAHETFYKKAACFLLAFSRNGNIKKLDLEAIGVQYNTNGIPVNGAMQTNIPHIFACGNAVGQLYTLNRVSYYQAQTAAQNATKYFWQKHVTVDYSHVTSYVHALRPLGSIGLTEQDAHKKYGKNIVVYRYTYNSLIKAHIEKTTDGIAKFICDTQGNLLGAHVLGAAADSIIDSVSIGEHFASQFEDYMLELRTSPNYVDIAWETSKQADAQTARSIWNSVLTYIQQIF